MRRPPPTPPVDPQRGADVDVVTTCWRRAAAAVWNSWTGPLWAAATDHAALIRAALTVCEAAGLDCGPLYTEWHVRYNAFHVDGGRDPFQPIRGIRGMP